MRRSMSYLTRPQRNLLLLCHRSCGTLDMAIQQENHGRKSGRMARDSRADGPEDPGNDGPFLHGYGIARRIEQTSGDLLSINYGTLYPALLKLEQEGYIASEWG